MKFSLQKLSLTPKQLDAQSIILIDKWLDIHSEECEEKDNNIALSKNWLNLLSKDGTLSTDSMGRIWMKNDDNGYHPYHFDFKNKNYGYRLAVSADN
jgi:hypothetical protein